MRKKKVLRLIRTMLLLCMIVCLAQVCRTYYLSFRHGQQRAAMGERRWESAQEISDDEQDASNEEMFEGGTAGEATEVQPEPQMLAGLAGLYEENQDMGTDGPTSIGQLIEILDKYGIPHAEKNTRISGKNPNPHPFSILTVHTNAGYTHWTLLYDGRYYDPEFGMIEGEYTFGRITSFLGIYERD